MDDTTTKTDSFLDITQLEGKAKGKVEIKDLDRAIATAHMILDEGLCSLFRDIPEEKIPPAKIAVFCHDCGEIVPAGLGQTKRGIGRAICGNCRSKKVSLGKEDSLRKFYHLEKSEKKE